MGARIAANASSTTIALLAIVTRSRRSRRHAIWAGERPRIAVVSGLASMGSGALAADSGETGTVTEGASHEQTKGTAGKEPDALHSRCRALFLAGRISHEHKVAPDLYAG